MRPYKIILIVLNLLLLLGYINMAIGKKESLSSEGKLILLRLAPVDPRSLMQGDYMRLSYDIAQGIPVDSIPKRGFVVVQPDSAGLIAKRLRLQPEKTPLSANEYLIPYTVSSWSLNIGAESFFFQEGQAEKFDSAKYGGIKLDAAGNSLLIGLYDRHLKKIE